MEKIKQYYSASYFVINKCINRMVIIKIGVRMPQQILGLILIVNSMSRHNRFTPETKFKIDEIMNI